MHVLTHHAQQRLQQRAIPEWIIDLLDAFGHYHYIGNGLVCIHLSKRALNRIKEHCDSHLWKAVINCCGAYVIESVSDRAVVTVGWRSKRIKAK